MRQKATLYRRAERGSPSIKNAWGRVETTQIRFLAEHTEIAQVIENRVRQLHGLLPPDAETPAEEEAKAASD